MKKLILVLLMVILPSFYGFKTLSDNDVYICISKTASKYHYSQNCKGLSRCTHTISKVSVKDAKNRGYSLCGWED
ncbi:hypothetical protein [Flavobacterium caseinilyticum]|jgi:hypothetical protein|uniref:Uncharacterized protein n=1 Tax=Flavobacterium caseinilyticum TaxID=2541732 RepID=A0A4R5AU89_9FLAO|nr:hypothetical protein [Flavobacterium caseinilyticum]TDD75266.1 hypothetical protein E0F89_12885 [Flavobacterium caseinilyticum]